MIEMQILGLSSDLWIGAILGTIISFIFYSILACARKAYRYLATSRPPLLILGDIANNAEQCLIFIRHLFIQDTSPEKTPLLEKVPRLVGGYGTLGTEAASYYLREHLNELGKEFGRKCFGIVVRVSISAGVQSVERLKQYDEVEQIHE
ncbi:MAG: hypothetical protein KAT65_07655 [Methanophagales archaeon]|nr:hypothetical protein [Methanophagales archaeon]